MRVFAGIQVTLRILISPKLLQPKRPHVKPAFMVQMVSCSEGKMSHAVRGMVASKTAVEKVVELKLIFQLWAR
ncbi:hypothetical protein L483_15250 [Pseudomonas putida H8234]|nr:hypothetical protein L483_15250 [Pseudomonas putida H8234]